MYRNFICYRGGSSAGSFFGKLINKEAKKVESAVGATYFSLDKEDPNEIRNFLNDPAKHIKDIKNFIVILTKDFLEGFIVNNEANPKSVTRIELEEAFKNKDLKFVLVQFPDFFWDAYTNGIKNEDILIRLYGEEAATRLTGTPAINYSSNLNDQVIEKVLLELDYLGVLKNKLYQEAIYKLESTPSVQPKPIFCGREEELKRIKELFDSGDRIIFLQGIGGIGKTEIAKQYAKRNKYDYDTVIYATYSSSIVELVSSQNYFKLNPNFPRLMLADGTQESDIDYFKRKIEEIKKCANERTLIIIDNFDVIDDEYFSVLTDAKYRLLITTRCDYSKFYPTIKIYPLDNIKELKQIFLKNYDGYIVSDDDPDLEELFLLVNRHTYTIELIAQHMESSCQSVKEMIEVLKSRGIVSLNEEVRGASDDTKVAYENLLKMFKVFDLNEDDKYILKILSLMPLNGVNIKDLKSWVGTEGLKTIKHLENRSWVTNASTGIALHPIIREVVRHELKIDLDEIKSFLSSFNETIKEENTWHYVMDVRNYYADIASEIINVLKDINDDLITLYTNTELLFSFGVKPSQAAELGTRLYEYFKSKEGYNSYKCAYYSFQIGWTYLFNMQLPDAVNNANKWFLTSLEVFNKLKLEKEDEFASYGHLLTHLCRTNLILYQRKGDKSCFDLAMEYANSALDNAIYHFKEGSPFYSRLAVAYM